MNMDELEFQQMLAREKLVVDALYRNHGIGSPPVKTDGDMLDWMIFNSATVCHSSDADFCSVKWGDRDGDHETGRFGNARNAISSAMVA